jgi:hypothetical protein
VQRFPATATPAHPFRRHGDLKLNRAALPIVSEQISVTLDEREVLGGVLPQEAVTHVEPVREACRGLDHELLHFALCDSREAWILENGRVLAGMKVLDEACAKRLVDEHIRFVSERQGAGISERRKLRKLHRLKVSRRTGSAPCHLTRPSREARGLRAFAEPYRRGVSWKLIS